MKNKLVDFNRFTLNQKIMFGIVLLCILVLTTQIISMVASQKNKMFDYKTFDANKLIIVNDSTADREIYWTLNGIIEPFIRAYSAEIGIPTDMIPYGINEYYNALTPDYKKFLDKKKYNELAKKMLDKFVYDNDENISLKTKDVIKQIYTIPSKVNNQDIYLCSLNTAKDNTTSYIGVVLDVNNKKYNIFYLE